MFLSIPLLTTAFVMGLSGGPHCLAMCAAPCAVVTADGPPATAGNAPASAGTTEAVPSRWRFVAFHAGRLAGYALLGALAAWAMEYVAWFSDRTSWLHPVWVGMHLAVLFWGGLMLVQGQQPRWLDRAGRAIWLKVRPLVSRPGGTFAAGLGWALLPCGLLYSAVLVAALSGGPTQGAVSMAAFGVGSGLWLWAAPWAWRGLQSVAGRWREDWGTRAAGAMLVLAGGAALWMDLIYKPAMWCR